VSAPVAAADGSNANGRLTRIKERVRGTARAALEPVVHALARIGVGPDALTILGCVLSLSAALAFFEGGFRVGAALAAASGLCDILDGALARERGSVSKFGAFLDSTLDRLGEAAILAGIAGFYIFNLVELAHDPARVLVDLERGLEPATWGRVAIIATLALVGSFLVSYTRARAEGLGIECKVGILERSERIVLLIFAGAFGVGPVMPFVLILLTVLSVITAVQRVVVVWKNTRGR
jgi:CDP-diacylglycerol--glycerol-3-phosphate 3-phosphatidyltransferase